MGRDVWIVENHGTVVDQRGGARRAVQVELGIPDDADSIRIDPGVTDQAAAYLLAGDEHMIEFRAHRIEADRAIARAMAGMHEFQLVQAVARFEEKRCFFRDDEYVQRTKEIEVVTINEDLVGRCEWLGQCGETLRPAAADTQRVKGKIAADAPAGEPDHLRLDARVGGRQDNVHVGCEVGERQGDRQAMRDLMHLIMIEEKAYPHKCQTPPWRQFRIFDRLLIALDVDVFVTGGRGVAIHRERG